MHFNGPIVRPPTDAYDVFVELTVGCTHNSCKFCNFYQGYPFRVASWEQIEGDLREAAALEPHAKRIWASGGNPYALPVSQLERFTRLVHTYLPEALIATYARVDDFKRKSVEDIRHLADLGFKDLLVGIESADTRALTAMNKGYTGEDVLRQLQKVEAAGVDYRVIYLGGIAGAGKCVESAHTTAAVLNRLHPYMMFLTTVAILPDTPLAEEVARGEFVEAGERERIEEDRALLGDLQNEIYIYARSVSSYVDFTAQFPQDKDKVIGALDDLIAHFTDADERASRRRRAGLVGV